MGRTRPPRCGARPGPEGTPRAGPSGGPPGTPALSPPHRIAAGTAGRRAERGRAPAGTGSRSWGRSGGHRGRVSWGDGGASSLVAAAAAGGGAAALAGGDGGVGGAAGAGPPVPAGRPSPAAVALRDAGVRPSAPAADPPLGVGGAGRDGPAGQAAPARPMRLRRRWLAVVGAAGAVWAAAALTTPREGQERPPELQVLVPPPLPTVTTVRPPYTSPAR